MKFIVSWSYNVKQIIQVDAPSGRMDEAILLAKDIKGEIIDESINYDDAILNGCVCINKTNKYTLVRMGYTTLAVDELMSFDTFEEAKGAVDFANKFCPVPETYYQIFSPDGLLAAVIR